LSTNTFLLSSFDLFVLSIVGTARMGLKEMLTHGLIEPYEVFADKKNGNCRQKKKKKVFF